MAETRCGRCGHAKVIHDDPRLNSPHCEAAGCDCAAFVAPPAAPSVDRPAMTAQERWGRLAEALWSTAPTVDVWPWVLEQNPAATEIEQALKVAEEAGEVCGALLKHGPGPEVVGEMADLFLALAGLVGALGIDGEWADVVARRWTERTSR